LVRGKIKQEAGAGGRSRRQEQEAGAGGRRRRQEQEAATSFLISKCLINACGALLINASGAILNA